MADSSSMQRHLATMALQIEYGEDPRVLRALRGVDEADPDVVAYDARLRSRAQAEVAACEGSALKFVTANRS